MKYCSLFLVFLLVLASIHPCSALVGLNSTSGVGPSPGQRDLRCIEDGCLGEAVIAGYVVTNTELIALLVAATGSVVGYATVKIDNSGVGDVLGHWAEFQDRVLAFTHGGLTREDVGNGLHFWSHDVRFYTSDTPEFSLIGQKYNTVKSEKDSYEDSKRKGIPVPGEGKHHDGDNYHKIEDKDWNIPFSSQRLFNSKVDEVNGCPKQIRYYNEKGEKDMDIDFSHEAGKDKYTGLPVTFPHKHVWTNGQRGGHNYEGIEEIIRNWRCKDYDFERGKMC